MPLEAPLGYDGRNEFGEYESGQPTVMLDDFIRKNGTRIYRIAFEAKNHVYKGQPLWRYLVGPPDGYTVPRIIVFHTREEPRTRRTSSLLFDPEDPISLEFIEPEYNNVKDEVKMARELEFQRALEEMEKRYGPDDKVSVVKHMRLKVHDAELY
jgi:hypothetical protein